MMRGRELKLEMARLMRQHNVRPIARAPIPLLAPTNTAQIVSGTASTSDIDFDRMSFSRNSLSWPALDQLPLVLRHNVSRIAGRVLALDYDGDGKLRIRAEVDDETARRMPAFSICATVLEAEIRNAHSASGHHAIVVRGVIDHVGLTDKPSNAATIVTSRRDVGAIDHSSDTIQAAAGRALRALEKLRKSWSTPQPAPIVIPDIRPAPGLILGNVPRALLTKPQTQFGKLVAQLPLED
jgi:hypothetical protein